MGGPIMLSMPEVSLAPAPGPPLPYASVTNEVLEYALPNDEAEQERLGADGN
jgi:hypothetical protein